MSFSCKLYAMHRKCLPPTVRLKLGFQMALFWSPSTSPNSSIQFHKKSAISKPLVSETLITTIPISRISEISLSASPNILSPNPYLRRFHCSAGSSSSIGHDNYPSDVIFIKGLPQSTSEGTLKRAFSHFGEVNRVKIITDKKCKQPLGFAYVWFTSEASAQMAVKEMNGKVHFRYNCEAWILQDPCKGNTIQVLTRTASSILRVLRSLSNDE